MDAAYGVGLAANQIGVSARVFVYDCAEDRGKRPAAAASIVNPVLETSEVPETMPDPDNDDEGCLSVPGESFPTGRADWARVTGLDADGTPITWRATGCSRACCSTRPDTSTGSCTWTGLVGRHARSAKRAVKSNGWGVPGLTWMPGEDPDPFGH